MAHPYRSAGRSGAKTKFKAILGTSKGAKHVNDDSVISPSTSKVKNGIEDVKIMGSKPSPRLDRFARGGKINGKTVVNIIVKDDDDKTPPPLPMPPPGALPPPPMGAKPPMPMGKPPMPLPPPGAGGPGAGLPLRARGGEVKKKSGGSIGGEAKSDKLKQWSQYASKNSYHKKSGGGIGTYPITGGADTGVARLQRSKKLNKRGD